MNIVQFKKKYAVKTALSLAMASMLSVPVLAQEPIAPIPYWKVEGGKLLDPYGKPFIFRGVTIDHTLAPEKTLQALKDAAALGANSAQIEFPIKYTDVFPRPVIAELREIVKTCKEQKLVCVLEPNDVAGFGSVPGSASPTATAAYWQDFYHSLYGAQSHIIIGLGNQHFDADPGSAIVYRSGIPSYVGSLINALPSNLIIMVDGNVWSQDTDKAMQLMARNINEISNLKSRVIFSVDFFDQYASPEKVHDYIATFAEIGAPLVIGGFAPTPYYHPYNVGPFPAVAPQLPVESVMRYAEQYGVGYFGWGWSGNKNSALDVVSNWNPNNLTAWGDLLFNGANGIKATAKRASIYGNTSSSSSSSSVSANQPPVADFQAGNYPTVFCGNPNVGAGKITASAIGSSDPDGDALTYAWSLGGSTAYGYEVSFPSQRWQTYQLTLTVTDSKGAATSVTKTIGAFYIDCPSSSSSSSRSSIKSSSSTSSSSYDDRSSSSVRTSSSSSIRTSSSSSVAQTKAQCSYQIQSQWGNGFTAVIRIKNTSTTAINGWDVNWQYADGSKITNLWNANLSGVNPYNAKNLSWNSVIQPGQTVEFGFQGSKDSAAASIPIVTGNICQ